MTPAFRVLSNDSGFIFPLHHFSFDSDKRVMIESESLLRQQFCFGGDVFFKNSSQCGKKDCRFGKKVVDS
jgi:hypothetical protein